jgi:hypothetical protein
MNKEVETVLAEPWFAGTIRAIVGEFCLHVKVRQARIRNLTPELAGKPINYGRYRLVYDEADNTIYVA